MDDLVYSDSEWSSDSGSGEDQDDLDFVYGGKAQSILSSLEQSIGRIDSFLSFERTFSIDDVVCSAADPYGQMGKVVDVHIVVDLENASGEIIEDVNCRKLQKIRSMSCGDLVVLGPWVGRVDKVIDSVTILYDDGTKGEVTTEDAENLLPLSPSIVEDSQYPHYPGQRVRVRSGSVSKSARWLCGNGNTHREEGTVVGVEAGLVNVHWFSCALFVCGFTVPPPPPVLDSKKLTLLSCFSHTQWHLGDWCILPGSECDGEVDLVMCNPTSHSVKGPDGLTGGLKQEDAISNDCKTYMIANMKINVDVLWQDGSYSLGLNSESLNPVNVVNSHEFWPGQFVSEKSTFEKSHGQKWGVVTVVDAKECTVGVNWRTNSGDQTTETASAYELSEHPVYKYSVGDLVFRAVHDELSVLDGQYFNNTKSGSTTSSMPVKRCGRDHSEYNDKSYLSCIGNVTGVKNGYVDVKWSTGFTTKVKPFEICHFEKDEISFQVATTAFDEERNAAGNEDRQSGDCKGKGKLDDPTRAADEVKSSPITKSFSIPQAAAGFLSIVASRLGLKSVGYNLVGARIVENPSDKELMELLPSIRKPFEESEIQESVGVNNLIHQLMDTRIKDRVDSSPESVNPVPFHHFDMISDCPDHHFIHTSGNGSVATQVTRGWLKKVQQEWANLETNLPDGLYVRVFEERMDLMRAVIVGASGTPYHDGLFFFDIYLPPEFPHVPPMVHYHSCGLRLNPNLYESGKVCLSLINTWTGNDTEVWNPGSSTILQILLSLQAIVLNNNPYFNEAGFDKQIGSAEGEKNAVSYKENAFVLACKSMLYLIRNPPQHFEAFMVEHFTTHAPIIITALKAYMEGAPVGLAFDSHAGTECSTGFKLILSKLAPQLVKAFSDLGIDCTSLDY